MVRNDGSTRQVFMAANKAMPVTMPGSAIGSTNSTVSESLAGKRARANAKAASVPRMSAITVAQAATASDSDSDCQMSDRANAASNQRSVSPGGGKR
jgi:hypothetical protein